MASVYMFSYYAVINDLNDSNDSVNINTFDPCLKAWKKSGTSPQKQQRLWQRFQDNKKQQSNLAAVTAAECWKAYQANMMAVSEYQSATEFIPGKSIMMAASSVKLVCNLLTPDTRVLEWGSGGSTLFFSKYVKSWDTIEHNVDWIPEMQEYTKNMSNVHFHSAKHTWNHAVGSDGTYKEFREYVEMPAHFKNVQSYDIIIIDGRARIECGRSVLRNRLLAENGVVLIHDWERCMYKEILDSFQVIKEVTSSKRHLGILVPNNIELTRLASLHSVEYLANLAKAQTFPTRRQKYNIVVDLYDSVGRNKFQRYLPKTFSFLNSGKKSRVNVEMKRLNIVGYNSNPNQYGFLTGHPWDWQHDLKRIENFEHPHLARLAKSMGFISALATDDCYAKLQCRGDFTKICCGDQRVLQTAQSCGDSPAFLIDQQHAMCTRVPTDDSAASVHFTFIQNVLYDNALSASPKFIYGQTLKAHAAGGGTVGKFDQPLQRMMQNLDNDTIYIVCSDHGYHVKNSYKNHRNPVLWFSFPKSFVDSFPNTVQFLQKNVNALMSPFDLHETIHELMSLIAGKTFQPTSSHGESFAHTIIDAKRTCKEANIPPWWCLDTPTQLDPQDTYLKFDRYIYQCSGREKTAGATMAGYDWNRLRPRRCKNKPLSQSLHNRDDSKKSWWGGGPRH